MAYEIKNKKNISTIGVHAGQEEVDETGSRVTLQTDLRLKREETFIPG